MCVAKHRLTSLSPSCVLQARSFSGSHTRPLSILACRIFAREALRFTSMESGVYREAVLPRLVGESEKTGCFSMLPGSFASTQVLAMSQPIE